VIRNQRCDLSATFSFKLLLQIFIKSDLSAIICWLEILDFDEGHRLKLPNRVSHRSRPKLLIRPILILAVVFIDQPERVPIRILVLEGCCLLHGWLSVESHDVPDDIVGNVSARNFDFNHLRCFPEVYFRLKKQFWSFVWRLNYKCIRIVSLQDKTQLTGWHCLRLLLLRDFSDYFLLFT
jgi:hypothetical protein